MIALAYSARATSADVVAGEPLVARISRSVLARAVEARHAKHYQIRAVRLAIKIVEWSEEDQCVVMRSTTEWQTYEEVAQYLLNQMAEKFGLGQVEGKQLVRGESRAAWEIDAKGICWGGEGFVVVECRRYATSRLSLKWTPTLGPAA